jgi:hypothetical protein
VELEALFPWVMPQVKACPEQTALHHIREALRVFCTKTLAWQANLSITTTTTDDDFLMPLPVDTSLVKLLRAGLDEDEALDIMSPDTADARSWSTKGRVWTVDRKRVLLAPRQAVAGKVLKLRVAVKPTRTSLVIDDQLLEDFAAVIADGALSTLLDMSDVTWANPGKAAMKADKFQAECGKTALRVSKGFGRSARSVKPFTR